MPVPAITASAAALINDCINVWSNKAPGGTDDQYWEGGQWVAGTSGASASIRQGGMAFAAAVGDVRAGPPGILGVVAEQTVDWALSPAGRTAIGWCGTGPTDGIETMIFLQDHGTVIVLLDGRVAPAKLAVWKAAFREGVDFLISAGHTAWYANGNINLGYALVVYLARRVLGDAKYDWRAQLAFAENPTQHPGSAGVKYGLAVEQSGSWLVDYDGCGYFTEQKQAGWPNGYDGEYTMVALDCVTRLALLSGDARALELTNMLLNKTLQRTRVDPATGKLTWVVDCRLGTRHMDAVWDRPLCSPALHVVSDAGRRVPEDVLRAQWAVVEAEYRSPRIMQHPDVVYYKGLGGWVGLIVLGDLIQRGVVPRVAA